MTRNDVRVPPTGDEPLLVAESVQKYYRNGEVSVHALVDLELVVRAGELVGVMGASGSGKTTLLNCLSGLDDIDGGRVLVSGRDLFAITVLGLRTSLFIAVVVTLITTVVGTLAGISAAYFGGWYDAVLSRLLDFLFGFPQLVFMIALGIVVPARFPRWLLLILVLSLFGWAGLARLIRNQARSLVAREFVEAARSVGSSGWMVITRELLPNLIGPVLVVATLAIPGYIGAEAALSFLGVGVPPPTPSLGRSISDSIAWVYTGADPWFLLFPGTMLFFAVLGFTLLGDGVRDAFDVRLRRTS